MRKGFTLIELLAVIVILAIIALIASPIIVGLIDDAKKESFKSSAYGIIKAGEILYSKEMMNGNTKEVTFTYNNGEESSTEEKILDYNGSKPNSGEVKINENGELALAIHNGKYCARKAYYESEVTISDKSEEECKIFICGEDVLYDSRDRQKYKTVLIGDQCWMAENLKYTSNGCLEKNWTSGENNACMKATETELQDNESRREWLQNEVWYQWPTAMNWDGINPANPGDMEEKRQGLCPSGWYIPNMNITLYATLGDNPATKIKAESPYWNGTDESGLNVLPSGYRGSAGTLFRSGIQTVLWLNFFYDNSVWGIYLDSSLSDANYSGQSLAEGSVIRCIYDGN